MDLPGLSFPAGWRGDPEDQSDSARVGEILRHRPLESVFLIHPILGRKEDPAPSGPGVPASRMRLEAVGQGMAVRNARTLLGVSGFLWAVDLGSRSGLIGLITLDVNCAGARSAGNPLATCDVAGAGNQLTVRIVRHSQRKRGATDRPGLRSNGTSPRPYRHSPTLTAVASRHSECRIRTEFAARRCIHRGPPWIPRCSQFPGEDASKAHLCRASGDPDRHLVEERASRGCVDCREAVGEREAYRLRQQASGGYML